jgi:hypothetical protein
MKKKAKWFIIFNLLLFWKYYFSGIFSEQFFWRKKADMFIFHKAIKPCFDKEISIICWFVDEIRWF